MERGQEEDGKEAQELLSLDLALEISGEEDPLLVTQLLLRNQDLVGFAPRAMQSLPNLQTLSLSHNAISSLQGLGCSLAVLTELNLNFNGLRDLEGLVAPALTKLYVSTNKLVDGSLTRFSERFPKLHTLCLFRNGFSALPEILAALRQLPKLRELDLDGNPCAHSSGYKHHIVRALGRLTTLDGDDITSLDRELADDYLSSLQSQAQSSRGGLLGTGSSRLGSNGRPSTAPAPRPGNLGALGQLGGGGGTGAAEDTSFNWKELPKDDPMLVASKRLNSNPVMVTYLAEQILSEPLDVAPDYARPLEGGDAREGAHTPPRSQGASVTQGLDEDEILGQGQGAEGAECDAGTSFVNRLRKSATDNFTEGKDADAPCTMPTPPAGKKRGGRSRMGQQPSSPPGGRGREGKRETPHTPQSPYDDAVELEADQTDSLRGDAGGLREAGEGTGGLEEKEEKPSRRQASKEGKVTFGTEVMGAPSGTIVDQADPYVMIRRLVKMVETLKEEREVWRNEVSTPRGDDGQPLGASSDQFRLLQRELTSLRIENANMFVLQEENRQLKAREDRTSELEEKLRLLQAENEELHRQMTDASEQLQGFHLSAVMGTHPMTPGMPGSSSGLGAGMGPMAVPRTPVNMGGMNAFPSMGGRSAGMGGGMGTMERPKTAAEVLDEVEDDMDAEVAELLARNETALEELKADVKAMKEEQGPDDDDKDVSLDPEPEADESPREEAGSLSVGLSVSASFDDRSGTSARASVSRSGSRRAQGRGGKEGGEETLSITELLALRRNRSAATVREVDEEEARATPKVSSVEAGNSLSGNDGLGSRKLRSSRGTSRSSTSGTGVTTGLATHTVDPQDDYQEQGTELGGRVFRAPGSETLILDVDGPAQDNDDWDAPGGYPSGGGNDGRGGLRFQDENLANRSHGVGDTEPATSGSLRKKGSTSSLKKTMTSARARAKAEGSANAPDRAPPASSGPGLSKGSKASRSSGKFGKVKPSKAPSLDRGDVITVHSPRHAAEILSFDDESSGRNWWE